VRQVRRVSLACDPGSSIRAIDANGTPTCETDDGGGKSPDSELLDGLDSTDFQRSNAVAGGDLNGSYPNPQIANGAVSGGVGGEIADNTITEADISDANGVRGGPSFEIFNGSVTTDDVSDINGVRGGTNNEIANNTVNADDLATSGVSGGQGGDLADNTVNADDIAASGVTASEMATLPAVKVRNSASIPVANNTHTVIPLDIEDIDQVGAGQTFGFTEMHSNTTNNFDLVAPRAGIYEVQVEVIWGASSTGATGAGERRITLRKNWVGGPCGEGSFDDMDIQHADPGDRDTSHISTLLTMDPGSNVFFCGYQNSGEAVDIQWVFASMHYVSAK
jgi:hypothetical protein